MLAGVWKAGVSNEFITPGEEIGKENVTFVYWSVLDISIKIL